MIRCKIECSYGTLSKEKLADPEYVAKWNAALEPYLWADKLRITEKDVAAEYSKSFYGVEATLSYDDMVALGKLGLTFAPTSDETSCIVRIEERLRELNLRMGDVERSEALAKGAACVIHVPDQSLMRIDEVQHLDDCCTDELQRELDDGWRILAVCPPCSQRRPDYILGRRKVAA